MDADCNVRNMATDPQDTALLDGHPVKYLSRSSLVQNLGGGDGMIVQKYRHQSGHSSSSQLSFLAAYVMQLQKY